MFTLLESARSTIVPKAMTAFTVASLGLAVMSAPAHADTCLGNCGTASPNGVVTAPPGFGPNYSYVSTSGGPNGAGQISGVGGTNGSEYITDAFAAATGDQLQFYFNYVTSDGSGEFTDYGFAELLMGGAHAAWLFTARTTPSGNTSPGFGLPANDSTLAPISTPIIAGGPQWAQLGSYSGECFDVGCGYTDWIQSTYSIDQGGLYQLRFGVANITDDRYDPALPSPASPSMASPLAEEVVPAAFPSRRPGP